MKLTQSLPGWPLRVRFSVCIMSPVWLLIPLVFCCFDLGGCQTIGTVATVAGGNWGSADGVGTLASFNVPTSAAVDAAGTVAVVVEYGNHLVRSIAISTRVVTTLAGVAGVTGTADGIGTAALFSTPFGVAMDAAGTFVVVVRCKGNCKVSDSATPAHSPPSASQCTRNTETTL